MSETPEASGPVPAAPVAAPVAAPAPGGMSFNLNAKSIMQVLAFVTAGAVSGGGVSFLNGPTEALSELKVTNEKLAEKVETVAVAMADIKGDLRIAVKDRIRIEDQIKDHEKRIRQREDCQCRATR